MQPVTRPTSLSCPDPPRIAAEYLRTAVLDDCLDHRAAIRSCEARLDFGQETGLDQKPVYLQKALLFLAIGYRDDSGFVEWVYESREQSRDKAPIQFDEVFEKEKRVMQAKAGSFNLRKGESQNVNSGRKRLRWVVWFTRGNMLLLLLMKKQVSEKYWDLLHRKLDTFISERSILEDFLNHSSRVPKQRAREIYLKKEGDKLSRFIRRFYKSRKKNELWESTMRREFTRGDFFHSKYVSPTKHAAAVHVHKTGSSSQARTLDTKPDPNQSINNESIPRFSSSHRRVDVNSGKMFSFISGQNCGINDILRNLSTSETSIKGRVDRARESREKIENNGSTHESLPESGSEWSSDSGDIDRLRRELEDSAQIVIIYNGDLENKRRNQVRVFEFTQDEEDALSEQSSEGCARTNELLKVVGFWCGAVLLCCFFIWSLSTHFERFN